MKRGIVFALVFFIFIVSLMLTYAFDENSDVDNDGAITLEDIILVAVSFGDTCDETNLHCGGNDVNQDGRVNILDLIRISIEITRDQNGNCFPRGEVCDGIDNDCDSEVDEGVCPSIDYYCDSDSDGYGSIDVSGSCNTFECIPGSCSEVAGSDCNDNNNNTWQFLTGYDDGDGDGYGTGSAQQICSGDSLPSGYVSNADNGLDCNDSDSGINPGSTEICDGIDNDCDSEVDEGVCPSIDYYCDEDGDQSVSEEISGSCVAFDCIPESCFEDSGDDCNDSDSGINPEIVENCLLDGKDNDCDGVIDECSCTNGIQDGDESDVDCGGSCGGCSIGDSCSLNSDCETGNCETGNCAEYSECLELYPGHNDASADRVNIIFHGLSYSSMYTFVQDMKQAVNLDGSPTSSVRDTVGLLVSNGAGTSSRISGSQGLLNDVGWHNIVATYVGGSSTGLKLYLDGNLVGTESTTNLPNIGSNSDSLTIGTSSGVPASQSLDGSVDEFSIWNRALNYNDVQEIYNSGLGSVLCESEGECESNGEIISYLPFEDSGDDLAGNYGGSLIGNTFVDSGKLGNSIYFDGNGDYVDLGDNIFDGISEFSVSIWFKVDDLNKDHALLSKGVWGGDDLILIWRDEEVSGSASAGPGLMEITAYEDNKDKFNFWYIDEIFVPRGDPSSSCTYCYNYSTGDYCRNLPNSYRANFCDLSFRSCAYFGSQSFNSVTEADWPFVFVHEFQHQFPELADEYTEGTNDRPRYPNCAGDLATAQSWWSDLIGQTGSDGGPVDYYAGCSYVADNYRSSSNSVMRSRGNYDLGLVNELAVLEKLSEFSGTNLVGGTNAMEVTLAGNPEDLGSYNIKEIKSIEFSSPVKTETEKELNINIRSGDTIFNQGFNTYDELVIEEFGEHVGETGIEGEFKRIPKEEVKVIVPTGNARYNEARGIMEFPSSVGRRGALTGLAISLRERVPVKIEISNEEGKTVQLREDRESRLNRFLRIVGLKE